MLGLLDLRFSNQRSSFLLFLSSSFIVPLHLFVCVCLSTYLPVHLCISAFFLSACMSVLVRFCWRLVGHLHFHARVVFSSGGLFKRHDITSSGPQNSLGLIHSFSCLSIWRI